MPKSFTKNELLRKFVNFSSFYTQAFEVRLKLNTQKVKGFLRKRPEFSNL